VEELHSLIVDQRIPMVIFDDDLTPAQVRNLEAALECKVVDRSGLILDIFASRAKSSEARTQVELAQLQYMLPRLTRAWTHLSKQFGGIGTKGPGETQIETDRRMVRTRISHLQEKLERIGQQRLTQRKGRRKHIRASLVGYTNVGKSTLLNVLSGSDVFVENRLFATLDPTTRFVDLGGDNSLLVTDTVGFIRKLPHHLVASFKSTLEEVTEADLLLHVVDVSHPFFEDQVRVVQETLEELNAGDRTTLMVFNKVDRLQDRTFLTEVARAHPAHVFISATRGINLLGLKEAVLALVKQEFCELVVRMPHMEQRSISQIFDLAEVSDQRYEGDEAFLTLRVAVREEQRLRQMVKEAGGVLLSPPDAE
jgi:GTP-binding protein HflX